MPRGKKLVGCSVPVFACAFVQAGEPSITSVAIDSQPLDRAIAEWATQTGYQVLLAGETAHYSAVAPSVQGSYTPERALRALLARSDLAYQFVNARTAAIGMDDGFKGSSKSQDFRAQDDAASGSTNSVSGAARGPLRQARLASDRAIETESTSKDLLEQVVVTAQKREENLKDVPISISVLNGQDLDRSNVDLSEALARVPGVTTTVGSQGGGTQLAVRGVTASGPLVSGASPIAYYLDSVPFGLVKTAAVPDVNAYDLERIEVLRGPQGTLYGATALNGVVRILTKDADLDDFDLKGRGSFSSTNSGGTNYRADAAINAPIIPGKLAARAVLDYENLSGWIDKPNERNANDSTLRNARVKLNAKPTDAFSLGLSAWISRSDVDAPPAANTGLVRPTLLGEPITTDYDAYGLTMGYAFPAFSITSMTGYLNYKNDSAVARGAAFDSWLFTNLDADVFSQEVVVNSTTTGAWRWSVGAMYRDAEDRLFQNFSIPLLPAPVDFTTQSESFAVFGQVTRLLFDGRLELTGGFRHFEDDVTGQENVKFGGGAAPLTHTNSNFNANSPRAVITWHANDQLTFYSSYAEGFRSGFDQYPTALLAAPTFPPVHEDKLKNYEIGAKGAFLDGRVSYEAAAYYIDWQDVMQTILVNFQGQNVTATINGDSASGTGVDFAAEIQPIEGLEFGANFSWNDLTMDGQVVSGTTVLFNKGDRLAYSPKYTIGALIGYAFPLGEGGLRARFSASGNYISEQETRTIAAGALRLTTGDPMLIARASFSIESSSRWSATLFGENLNNEQGVPIVNVNPVNNLRIRPRTIGAQLEWRFH